MRGTTREAESCDAIAAAGIEPAIADPDRLGTLYDHLDAVALVYWLMGSASGPGQAEALNGPRLGSLLEKVVDTPVRGFVHEAAGTAPAGVLEEGARLVSEAGERWRIPAESVRVDPGDPQSWLAAMVAATALVTGR